MKIGIIYATKTGTVEKCVKLLSQKLRTDFEIDLINIQEKDCISFDYDIMVIGSYIRIGMMNKKILKFLKENQEKLESKKVAYFICCGFEDNKDQYFTQNIPSSLLEKALQYQSFGGEIDLTKQKGIDKWIVSMVMKNQKENEKIEIKEETIEEFVKKVEENIDEETI